MKDKVILVDVDGVLVDWGFMFDRWMSRHNYLMLSDREYDIAKRYDITRIEKERLVRMFNESATIRKMPPLRDAIKYVRKLHQDHGYIFHVISSLSTDEYSQHLRTKNLRELFGATVFDQFIYLDTGADKDEALDQYNGTECFWVEDKMENADVGLECGLNSLLMAHNFNSHYAGNAQRVQNWKEIYDIIVK